MSDEQPKNLTTKLSEVGETLAWIKKRGKVVGKGENSFGYNFATEADLVFAIRMELFKRHIFLYPRTLSSVRVNVPGKTYKDGTQTTKNITDTDMEWKWVDGDTGEERICSMPGCGEDSGDKCTPKSITMSEKYFLLKSFLVPTFDDEATMSGADKKVLVERVAKEKIAEGNAKIAARKADTDEEAQKELLKAEVLFIRLPDRFQGEHAAVYGKAISREAMIQFFADCDASRFKGPEGIFYKLEARYLQDCKTFGERQGFTVDYDPGEA